MRTTLHLAPWAASMTVVVATACAHTPDRARASLTNGPTQTTVTSFDVADPGAMRRNAEPYEPSPPNLDDPNHPGNRLANAACDRKLECDQVGDGRAFATRQDCLMAARRHADDDLDRTNCENGIDDARLAECIHAVRLGACSADFAMAGRYLECRGDHLCGK